MPSAHEHFSEQFQKWEVRGRGWQVFPQPVYPEPPFVPFRFRPMTETPVVDNGRRQTFLSSLARKLARPTPPPAPVESEEEPQPTPLIRGSIVELQAALPDDFDVSNDSFERFFGNLALCREPVAFELLGGYRRVLVQFAAAEDDVSLVRKQLAAHFPDIKFSEHEGTLESAWTASEGNEAFAVEFGLGREFMLPLATGKLDPFAGIVAALSELRPGELGLYQVLWQPVQNPWADNIIRSVSYDDGKPLFINAQELTSAAEKKAATPLYAAVVRIVVRTTTRARLYEIARDMATSLRAFSNPQGNTLIPIHNRDYPYLPHLEDVIFRRSRRSGMILGSDELSAFVHLPSSDVRSPVLLRDAGRTKPAPGNVRQPPGVVIGDNEHDGDTVAVYLTADQRVRHTHIIGLSGTGKSSLLFTLIRQDIENGEGVGVLDPHGDLINQILGIIPDDRIDDVVLVDPSDIDFPIGFNILSAHSDDEKSLLASDLIAVFRRLSTSWGDQMDTVLQNAILAFLESSQGGTLSDLRLFLLDEKYRKQFLQTVADPEIIFYWQNVFPKLTGGKSIGPVLTRLQDFFSRKPLRNMVGQQENKLDFADIMDSGKIFLARLPEGCGEENSYLLGTLLVSKFQQLAMARQSQAESARKNFWLYIDEFDSFISPSMAKILSRVRKYRLGLTLAHQELHQLHADPKVESAVLTHPCTRIVFHVGDDDAKKLSDGFESFDAKSLKNLAKFHAIARVERNDCDFNLTLRKPEMPDETEAQSKREKIIAASRAKYATHRAEVEAALLARIWGDTPQPPKAAGTPGEAPTVPPANPPSVFPASPFTELRKLPASRIAESTVATGSETKDASVATQDHPAFPTTAARVQPSSPPPLTSENVAAQKAFEASKESELRTKPDGIEPTEPKDLGRGKALHQTIQKRLQGEAHTIGFSAKIEGQLKAGSNEAADLLLQKGDIVIAVEIAVTTEATHEFENIQKNLKAGITRIAVVSTSPKRLESIAAAVKGGLGPEAAAKVSYHSPDDFLAHLQKLSASMPQKTSQPLAPGVYKSHGKNVKVHFPQQLSAEEESEKNDALNKIIRDVLNTPKQK